MSARTPAHEGWVTVAAAAAALTDAGDPIDPSNVSRYLARNPEVPQEKDGKFRYVDLVALKRHRNTSLYVADKRTAREPEAPPEPKPSSRAAQSETDYAPPGSALAAANLQLKQLDVRRREREEAVEEGRLIPAEEVQVLCAGMLEAYAAELARQEGKLATRWGREVAADVRKAHRAARAAACATMTEAARANDVAAA